jgi:L-threonylcarbamoyladenylate synthase
LKTELLDATSEDTGSYRASITRAAELLKSGELVAFPTDTVYGVAAIPDQPGAVARLYVAKARPPEKAIPILLADVQDLDAIVRQVSDHVRRLVERFWPGGLTLILPKSNAVPAEVSPTSNVAVRLPDLLLTRQIIAAVGTPLAVTSANQSGQPSTCTAAEVLAQLRGRIAAIVDGGACPGGVPSTILDCTYDPPRVLRAGAIPLETLRQVTSIA